MRRCPFSPVTIILIACGVPAAHASENVGVFFRTADGLTRVQRTVPAQTDAATYALRSLAGGPTTEDRATGIFSAIPAGTSLLAVVTTAESLGIAFSEGILSQGMDDARLEAIVEQVRATLAPFDVSGSVRLTTGGRLLSEFIPPSPPLPPNTQPKLGAPMIKLAAGSALTGRTISLSPGHGLKWGGSSWTYARPVYCAPLTNEDLHNVDLTAYLNVFLAQDGATTKAYRCLDKTYGNYASGKPWWYMASSYWLQNLGYPCTVYSSSSGNCTLGSGASEDSDNIRGGPVASDYDNTTIHIAMHTNGNTGDCTGSGCANGTSTYYDNSTEHAAWGAISKTLAQNINTAIVDVIRTKYTDAAWRDRGAIDAAGAQAETRVPNRAAVLIELAFHDTCDRDAIYLRDKFFCSATMWGAYKGVCDYFGATPTFGFYSDEYVSDTIPATMLPGATTSVSITFKNRGVLWTDAKAYRLGAVGDSDPLSAATRIAISGEVDTGATYTFTFNLKAPTTSGTYTTDWQMVRDSFTWFGAICSRQVMVAPLFSPADFDHDRDVDQADFGHFQSCLTARSGPIPPGCEDANLQPDSGINEDDLTKFLDCMLGPDVVVDPACGT